VRPIPSNNGWVAAVSFYHPNGYCIKPFCYNIWFNRIKFYCGGNIIDNMYINQEGFFLQDGINLNVQTFAELFEKIKLFEFYQ
jgi:hypothetical protein